MTDNPFPAFYFIRLSFTIQFVDETYLPTFKGFTLRGGLGDALLALVCTCPVKNKAPHEHRTDCRYQDLFKTQIESKELQRRLAIGKDAPSPMLVRPAITPKQRFLPGNLLHFDILLIGRAARYWEMYVEAVRFLGAELGIAKNASKFRLLHVYDPSGQLLYDNQFQWGHAHPTILSSSDVLSLENSSKRQLYLSFLTPVFLRESGDKSRHAAIKPSRFSRGEHLENLFKPLVRRLHVLTNCYCEEETVASFYDGLYPLPFETLELSKKRLSWVKAGKHFSRVQQDTRSIEGFTGILQFNGRVKPFLPFFQLAQYVGIGKDTICGMGSFELL